MEVQPQRADKAPLVIRGQYERSRSVSDFKCRSSVSGQHRQSTTTTHGHANGKIVKGATAEGNGYGWDDDK